MKAGDLVCAVHQRRTLLCTTARVQDKYLITLCLLDSSDSRTEGYHAAPSPRGLTVWVVTDAILGTICTSCR